MKLQVIIASTRPGRIGGDIGRWFANIATQHDGFDVEVTDLAELALPFHDEPHHPMTGNYVHEHTRDWSRTVAGSDAFVLVMPEYNHGFSAPLKNALDFLNKEWADKPVGFVSYGGIAGGTRAVHMIKEVVTTLRMVPVLDGVIIPLAGTMVDADGFHPTPVIEKSATTMLDELVRLATALRAARPAA